ncbi:uncharacterized protein LAESUDRAFT_660895, partial [Laetiporus sulphureus 93-53]
VTSFDLEVAVVWRRKFTGATILYLLLHTFTTAYLGFFYGIWFENFCKVSWLLLSTFCTPKLIVPPVIASFRVYAIGGRKWKLPAIVFGLKLVIVAADMVSSVVVGIAVTQTCTIVADVIVLVVTWHATYSIKKMAKTLNVNVSTTTLLLRDGRLPTHSRRAVLTLPGIVPFTSSQQVDAYLTSIGVELPDPGFISSSN